MSGHRKNLQAPAVEDLSPALTSRTFKAAPVKKAVTLKLRFQVMQRDNFRCTYCGASAEEGVRLEVDHILPMSKGGPTLFDNLTTACWQCNHGKQDLVLS